MTNRMLVFLGSEFHRQKPAIISDDSGKAQGLSVLVILETEMRCKT